MKLCSKCGLSLPDESFRVIGTYANRRDNFEKRSSWCNGCELTHARQYAVDPSKWGDKRLNNQLKRMVGVYGKEEIIKRVRAL